MNPLLQADPRHVGYLMIAGFIVLLCLAALVSSMFSDREWDLRWDRRDDGDGNGEDAGD